ncbi:MAG: alpha/beta fold hydrolase [Bacteroidetes bacterium]|nr:alpha/beta fold hydrolase [Bacteroidota bacterium]
MRLLCLLMLLTTSNACLLSAQKDDPIITQSEWVGYIQLLGQMEYARIFTEGGSTFFELPDRGTDSKFRINIVLSSNQYLLLKAASDRQEFRFEIDPPTTDKLQGRIYTPSGIRGFVHFYQVLEEVPENLNPYTGTYVSQSQTSESALNKLIVWESNGRLRLHSAFTQKHCTLKRIGQNTWYSRSGEVIEFQDLIKENYQDIHWQFPDGQSIVCKRMESSQIEDHQIVLDEDIIGASLYLPAGNGPHPACIIPMGAANYDRSVFDLEARLFAEYGIATLIYDNYGNGKSNGNLRTKSFRDKQEQLVKLMDWLATQEQIDPDKIGLAGGSQGGRIAIMAAAERPKTAFLVLLATPLETRMDQQLYAIAEHHRQQGFAEDVITQSNEVWRRFFVSADAGLIDNTMVETAHQLAKKHPNLDLPRLSFDQAPHYARPTDIMDATADYLGDVDCPILCLFGSLDDRVPPQKSINILQETLAREGKEPAQIVWYEGVGHSFSKPGFRIQEGLFLDQIRFMLNVVN